MDTAAPTSNRLRIIRGEMTQAEFARVLGLHKNTLGRYERGESEPDMAIARNVCTIFGVSPRWLLFGDGPMTATDCPNVGEGSVAPDSAWNSGLENLREEILELRKDNKELRDDNNELRRENRELRAECRELAKENKELRQRLAESP